MQTVEIFEKEPDGTFRRIGTFRVRKYASSRSLTEQFLRMHPHADVSRLYYANRGILFGRACDVGELTPFEPLESKEGR